MVQPIQRIRNWPGLLAPFVSLLALLSFISTTFSQDDERLENSLQNALAILAHQQISPTPDGLRQGLQVFDPNHPLHQELEQQAKGLVDQLDSPDYLVRENASKSLKRMITLPLAQLELAVESLTPEIAYRAQAIIDYSKMRDRRDTETGVIESIAVVVQASQIKGMADILLSSLSRVQDRGSLVKIQNALDVTALDSDAPLLRKLLTTGTPSQRAAGAITLLHLSGETVTDEVKFQLAAEKDDSVRMMITRELANLGDRDSLPVLVDLLESGDVNIRVEANQVLQSLTGLPSDFVAYDSAERRTASAGQWRAWVDENKSDSTLHFPLVDPTLTFERILYSDYQLNKVVEVDMNGKEIWSMDFNQPWSVQGLPNGNRLISSYSDRTVVELDRDGKEVWKLKPTKVPMMGMHRIENGNLIIGQASLVIEYDRDGKTVWSYDAKKRVSECQRLKNGNTLLSLFDGSSVVEVNPVGDVVWSIDTDAQPMSVHRTDAGTTLVACLTSGVVKEFDQEKKLVWEFTGDGQGAGSSVVRRLPNGDTLISGKTKIQLVRPDKTVRWKIEGLQHSFGASAY